MSDTEGTSNYVEFTAEIVAAYVSNNTVATSDLAGLMREVHAALVGAATGTGEEGASAAKPAVPVRKSVTPDYPMVAPNYAQARSQLAKQMGLGQQRRTRSAA